MELIQKYVGLILIYFLKLICFFAFPAVKEKSERLCIVAISSGIVVYTTTALILSKIHNLTDYQPTTNCFAYQFSNAQYL